MTTEQYLVSYGNSTMHSITLVEKRRRRNSPARVDMLANRHAEQRARRGTFMRGVPAWQNRRTGKPHEHNRQKARRLRA